MSEWKKSEPADNRSQREIIFDRIEMLAAVFNRKISEQMIVVFQEALGKFSKSTLKAAFSKAEVELERFPTPKIMRSLCYGEMPSRTWRYSFTPSHDAQGVPCLLDPDPDCDHCREPRSKHPHEKCKGFDGSVYMYKPQDCEEGRAFLAKMKAIHDKGKIHFSTAAAKG